MKLSEVREWVREHGATVSVGTIVLNGEQRPAAICAADGKLLAVRVWPGNLRIVPSVFEQSWDWDCGHWDTRFVGELPEGLGMDADELHALITGECPRCHGAASSKARRAMARSWCRTCCPARSARAKRQTRSRRFRVLRRET